MVENRQSERESSPGISALIYGPNGAKLEGAVQDVSDGGIKVSGNPAGLKIGDCIDIALIVGGERVRYACEVKHVAPKGFGVRFQSGPKPDVAEQRVKRCMQCRRDFEFECRFCSHCGQKLVTR